MKNVKSTSWLSIISIAILLIFLGLFLLLSFHTKSITDNLKKKANIIVELADSVDNTDLKLIADRITTLEEYESSSIQILDEDYALDKMAEEIDEDWLRTNENPFNKVVVFNVQSEFYYLERIKRIKSELLNIPGVNTVNYEYLVYDDLEKNITRFSTFLFVLGIFFSLMTIVLIHNNLHLALSSDKSEIRTMKLVGAEDKFIMMPYLRKSFSLGLIGFFVFMVLMLLVMYLVISSVSTLNDILIPYFVILMLVLVFLMAVSIPMISTYMIVRLYLRNNSNIYL